MRTLANRPKAHLRTIRSGSAGTLSSFRRGADLNAATGLQRVMGNQAAQRLLRSNDGERPPLASNISASRPGPNPGGIPTRLEINEPGDVHEQEAERLADHVMGTSEPAALNGRRRTALPGGKIQAQAQAKTEPSGKGGAVPAVVNGALHAPGRPLDVGTRDFMEGRFGQNFSGVVVHTSAVAERAAAAVGARAFTYGQHIVFGRGEYAPHTHRGRHLISHELAHVVQQSSGFAAPRLIQRQTSSSGAGGISEEWLHQIARVLHDAMDGLGTDEEAIYSALSGRTQDQVDAIARVYKENYGSELLADLKDELSDSELEHLAIFSPTAAPGAAGSPENSQALADLAAAQLNRAMKGWGTDEESIYAALTGRTQAEIDAIRAAYKRLTNRELEDDLRDEMSGNELKRALFLLNQNVSHAAKNARLHLFTDIDVKTLGLGDVIRGDVGHTWISLEYKDASKVPATAHPAHKALLGAGGKYADPMGFWPAINEGIGFSVNPFSSWVKGWMRHPDRAHQGAERATETWDVDDAAVDKVIKYAESKRTAKYSVYSYNCTTFAKESVEAAGFSPPSMTTAGIAMPNAVYEGIKERQKKGIGQTSVKDFDTGKESLGIGPDEQNKKR